MKRAVLLLTLVGAVAAAATAAAFVGAFSPAGATASSHREAPLISDDPAADNVDVYAFVSPDRPNTVTLIATYIPFEDPAGGPNYYTFDPTVLYSINVDNNGDAKEDVAYQFRFTKSIANPNSFLYNTGQLTSLTDPDLNIRQTYSVTRWTPSGSTVLGSNIVAPPANIGPRSNPTYPATLGVADLPGGRKVFAGPRDDPFFFDLVGFLSLNFCAPGTNFFAGLNVSAIVLEVPSSALGSSNIGVWARTTLGDTQIDRMGRPAINTVFIPNNVFEPSGTEPSQRNAFNAAKPRRDQSDFRGEVVDTLEIFYGAGSPRAQALADFLLPDIMTINTASAAGFPNGRGLADDVIDIELALVTNSQVASDCVGNDSAFSTSFPYLAPAN